jgi:hypothetical protein
MGFSTFLIGCIPSYETIGFMAPVLVLILRLLQGLLLEVNMEVLPLMLQNMHNLTEEDTGLHGSKQLQQQDFSFH